MKQVWIFSSEEAYTPQIAVENLQRQVNEKLQEHKGIPGGNINVGDMTLMETQNERFVAHLKVDVIIH